MLKISTQPDPALLIKYMYDTTMVETYFVLFWKALEFLDESWIIPVSLNSFRSM